MGDGDRPALEDLAAEQRQDAAAGAQDIPEPDHKVLVPVLSFPGNLSASSFEARTRCRRSTALVGGYENERSTGRKERAPVPCGPFGNVLGSRGSILPLFRRQILKGGPGHRHHPDTRRFMTIPRPPPSCSRPAGWPRRGGLPPGHGESVSIRELAEQMIRFYGFEPGEDIGISTPGFRDGEKLLEKLTRYRDPGAHGALQDPQAPAQDPDQRPHHLRPGTAEAHLLPRPSQPALFRNRRACAACWRRSSPASVLPMQNPSSEAATVSDRLPDVPFSRAHDRAEGGRSVLAVMRSGWLTTGEVTARFEAEFAARGGRAARTGAQLGHRRTAPWHWRPWGSGRGNVVLTTPFTFAATAEVVRYLGADPVFCDIDSGDPLHRSAADRRGLERARAGAGVPLPSSRPRCRPGGATWTGSAAWPRFLGPRS